MSSKNKRAESPAAKAKHTTVDKKTEGGATAGLTLEQTKQRENSSKNDRIKYAVIMIIGFVVVIYLGHAYLCMGVLAAQFASYYELADVKVQYAEKEVSDKKKNDDCLTGKMPFFRTIQLSAFCVAIFDTWGSSIATYLEHNPSKANWMLPALMYQNIASKGLMCLLFILVVLSLTKRQVRFQLSQYVWTGLALVIVVFQLKYSFRLIFSGMFWFVLSLLLVITNDTMAYVCGRSAGRKIFGDRVFLDISPNKTWEGFIGGGIFTVMLSPILAGLLSRFSWMTCPGEVTLLLHDVVECAVPSAFLPGSITLPLLGTPTYAQWHALALGILASIVAPFGGFLASAIKRAYDIKDFADKIPGHGGVMDRIDCQLLMIFLTSTYMKTFVWEAFTVRHVVHAFSLLSEDDKKAALEMMKKVMT